MSIWYAEVVGPWLDLDVEQVDAETGTSATVHIDSFGGARCSLLRYRYDAEILRLEGATAQAAENVIPEPNVTMNRVWLRDDAAMEKVLADVDLSVLYCVEVPDAQTRG